LLESSSTGAKSLFIEEAEEEKWDEDEEEEKNDNCVDALIESAEQLSLHEEESGIEENYELDDELISAFIKIFKLGDKEKTIKMVVLPGEVASISFQTQDHTRASLVGKSQRKKKAVVPDGQKLVSEFFKSENK
jgi:hypothetical protein